MISPPCTSSVRDPSALKGRIRQLVADHGVQTIVETGARDPELTRWLSSLGREVFALEVPAARRSQFAELASTMGSARVRVGHRYAPQALADLQPRLARRTLYYLKSSSVNPRQVCETIFRIPRGEGVLVIPLGELDGPRSYGDVQDQLLRWSPLHQVDFHADGNGDVTLIVQPQRRVHVTFLIEKYSDEYGTSGSSVNWDNLVATLQMTGLATHDVLLHDERYHEGREITLDDLRRPDGVDDHLLVCTYNYLNDANPPVELLEQARRSGTALVYVWLDKKIRQRTPAYARVADVNVILDCSDFEFPRSWPIFTPKNPMHYHDPGYERTIDVSVLGEFRFLRQRQDWLAMLRKEERINLYVAESSATCIERKLSLEDYTRVYKTSKISLALTKDRTKQLKGRVFEVILCGSMLLCDTNPYINGYFAPGREYVPFVDFEDMVEKCRYYLAHDAERAAIARAGHEKATRYYNHRVFWRGLLARAFPAFQSGRERCVPPVRPLKAVDSPFR